MVKCFLLIVPALVCVSCDRAPAERQSKSSVSQVIANSPVEAPVRCDLRVLTRDQHMIAEITFTNVTENEQSILRELLLDDANLMGPPLAIARDGVPVKYRGWIWDSFSSRREYTNLAAGESITVTLTLSDCYSFDKPGQYVFVYRGANDLPSGESYTIASPTVAMTVE